MTSASVSEHTMFLMHRERGDTRRVVDSSLSHRAIRIAPDKRIIKGRPFEVGFERQPHPLQKGARSVSCCWDGRERSREPTTFRPCPLSTPSTTHNSRRDSLVQVGGATDAWLTPKHPRPSGIALRKVLSSSSHEGQERCLCWASQAAAPPRVTRGSAAIHRHCEIRRVTGRPAAYPALPPRLRWKSELRNSRYFCTTPQAILAPALPAGSVI